MAFKQEEVPYYAESFLLSSSSFARKLPLLIIYYQGLSSSTFTLLDLQISEDRRAPLGALKNTKTTAQFKTFQTQLKSAPKKPLKAIK
jgi:Leu/Phe-tRNA-protein transferase